MTLCGNSDFTFKWYKVNKSGGQEELIDSSSLTLTNIDDNFDYKIAFTHITYTEAVLTRTYRAVYINDLEADWNYYYGLNYVNATSNSLPSGENQDIYKEANIVQVSISYSGSQEFNNILYKGTVSQAETESDFMYYKYYPVENGKVRIELIDNPFTNRPTGKGFNNWVSEDGTGTIIYDSVLYKRYIEIDVAYSNGMPQDINLALNATWVDATVVEKTSDNTWATVFADLNTGRLTALQTSSDFTGQSMAGYYLATTLGSGTNLSGYYDVNGVALSGTASSGTTYYRLIQSYDANKTYSSGNSYYYMVTRDTNIVYLTGNITNTWASAQNKPFTFTGLYGGINYGGTWSSTIAVQTYNDTAIENLRISSTIAVSSSSTITPSNGTTAGYIYGNYKNLKVGRGIVSVNSNYRAFAGIVGGGAANTGSAANPTQYNIIIESGTYNLISLTCPVVTTSYTAYLDMYGVYGCDYDRSKGDDSKLDIYFVASGSHRRNY